MASFVYRRFQEQLTEHLRQLNELYSLDQEDIGNKIINRPKGQTACEAADKVFHPTVVIRVSTDK